jgi:hypothetical protein
MNPVEAKAPQPEYTRELVEFLHGLRPEGLPREVLDRARYFLLDTWPSPSEALEKSPPGAFSE